ncbi:MAG: DUF2314 domain-containing protein [Rhizobiales bacterium]|nr:DUF2314 domain-containing protein [Hyphomicrobiales bacterium]
MKFKIVLFIVFSILIAPTSAFAKNIDYRANQSIYQFAIFSLGGHKQQSLEQVKATIKAELKEAKIVAKFSKKIEKPEILLDLIHQDGLKKYRPQNLRELKYFGRGLTGEEANKLQKSKEVLVVTFLVPKKYGMKFHLETLNFMASLAKNCSCVLWDETTRETYSLSAWKQRRLTYWENNLPIARFHFTVHYYKSGNKGLARAISLGMGKFGLPDIVINDMAISSGKSMVSLLNVIAQAFVENNKIASDGSMLLQVDEMVHKQEKEILFSGLKKNRKQKVLIKLRPLKKRDAGDPNNLILEVKFDHVKGKNLQEKQEQLVSDVFGSEDKVSLVKHNQAIKVASQKARAKLPQLKREVLNKFRSTGGGYLLLKGPFKTPNGGNEWMWVEVMQWKGREISGFLKNEPRLIPNLKVGAKVTIKEGEVFDYIRVRADGTSDGNETGKLILKYQKSQF